MLPPHVLPAHLAVALLLSHEGSPLKVSPRKTSAFAQRTHIHTCGQHTRTHADYKQTRRHATRATRTHPRAKNRTLSVRQTDRHTHTHTHTCCLNLALTRMFCTFTTACWRMTARYVFFIVVQCCVFWRLLVGRVRQRDCVTEFHQRLSMPMSASLSLSPLSVSLHSLCLCASSVVVLCCGWCVLRQILVARVVEK